MSLTALAVAVESMANTLLEVFTGSPFSDMPCGEVDSIVTVFVVAGRTDAAAHVIMMHGEGDDVPGDEHHDVYAALQAAGAGFSHDETDEPYRLAMAHARKALEDWS